MSAEDSDNFEEDMDLAAQYDDSMGDEPLFWSMTIEPNKTTDISEPAISGYIVHITNACFGVTVNKNSRSVIMINNDTPICTLIEGKHENQQLDLLFNEAATISVKGNKPSNVYLTGYIQPAIDNDIMDPMAEDMTEAEIEEALRRQREQQQMYDDEDDNDDDDRKQEESFEEEPQLIEDEIDEPPNKKQKTSTGNSKTTKNGNNNIKSDEKKRKSPLQKPKEKEIDSSSKNDEKKNKKKNKKMQSMKGGIKYRDMKIGSGKLIKNGSKVNVFYVGQTESKKVFDKSISGTGFEFTFGNGDVIKGWDVGLKGMKVGGKRKLIIPPKMAYGANGSPPQIGSNATLTFTIELKDVN